MNHLQLQHPERLWMAAVWLGVVVLLLVWGYWNSPLRGMRRWAAILCKALALLLLGACLLDPVAVTETPRKGANEIIVLADNSASLTVAEQAKSKPRSESLREALTGTEHGWPKWLDGLRSTFRVRLRAVDERTRSIDNAAALDFKGAQSQLSNATMAVRDRRSASVAAVVLLSDGNATDAEAWKNEAGGAPVFPILVGNQAPEHDLSLTQLSASQSAFEDAPVLVTARVAQTGFVGQEVALRVLDEANKVLVTEKHRFNEGETHYVFRARVPLVKPGVSLLRIETKSDAKFDEATLENNARVLAVDRGAGPYRILYISGRPNWEHKFLRRAIALDAEIQLPSLIRIAKREPKFEFRSREGESSNPLFRGFASDQQSDVQRYDQPVLIRLGTKDKVELADGFPKAPEALMGEFRAIIIDDLEAEFFTQEQMNLVEKFVSARGGSLLMLGGAESYHAGHYDNTPVGRMLPVYLDKTASSEPMENAKFSLTREGWLEPSLRLRSEQTQDEARIAQLPGFYSVNQTSSIKPGAIALATVTDEQQRQTPALVTQHYGSGRVAALTIGDVWRWGMKDAEQHADMDKMWRQIMRWLVTDVPDRIELQAKLSQVSGQQTAKIEARVNDAAFHPQDDASVQIEVTPPGKAKPITLYAEPSVTEPGLFDADYYPSAAGGYRIKATIKDSDGKPLGEKTTGFALNPMAEEMATLAPNREWMQRLAKDTGGQVIKLADIAKLADILPKLEVPTMDRKTQPVWHSGWLLALIILLLAGEWALRRTGGIV